MCHRAGVPSRWPRPPSSLSLFADLPLAVNTQVSLLILFAWEMAMDLYLVSLLAAPGFGSFLGGLPNGKLP